MWLLPSLNRRLRLLESLAAIRQAGCTTPGTVILGPGQRGDLEAVKAALPLGSWRVELQNAKDQHLSEVLNRFLATEPPRAWYGLLQDDMLVGGPQRWDTRLAASAGRCGMASTDDHWQANRRMAGIFVFGGDLLRAWGFWSPPGVRHMYMDNFWQDVGERCGNWMALLDIKARHVHSHNNTARGPKDATYTHSYSAYKLDGVRWEQYRRSPQYADLIERVKKLLADADDSHMEVGNEVHGPSRQCPAGDGGAESEVAAPLRVHDQ